MVWRDLQESARTAAVLQPLSGEGKGSNGGLEMSAVAVRLPVPLTQILELCYSVPAFIFDMATEGPKTSLV